MTMLIDVLASPWAMQPEKLTEISNIYFSHLRGDKIDISKIEASFGDSRSASDDFEVIDGVAILSMHGVLGKKMNMFSRISGGTSMQVVERDLNVAINDDAIHSIILDIDSPGGTVDGTAILADAIAHAAIIKPVVSLASGVMASGAVWTGTAARKVYITDETTMVGSIGVAMQHIEDSAAQAKYGYKVTDIYSGKYKRIDNSNEPLSQEGREYMQSQADYLYSIFVNNVAKNLNVSVETVLNDMADGRIFIGQQAIEAGLVDGVSTMENLIAMLNDEHGDKSTVSMVGASSVVDDGGGFTASENLANKVDEEMTDKASIEKDHPEIAKAFREEGAASVDIASAVADAEAKGRVDGAESERKRIQDVRGQSLVGHEKLIETLAFDGETTGEQAAVQILQAERKANAKVSTDASADADDIPDVDNDTGDQSESSIEMSAEDMGAAAAKLVADAESTGKHMSLADAMTKVMEGQ